MSSHHAAPADGKSGANPIQMAIAVTAGSVGLIIGIILLAYFAVGSQSHGASNAAANSPAMVAARIAPVVSVATASTAAVAAPAAASSAPAAAPAPKPVPAPAAVTPVAVSGESVYKSACFACHDTGAAGAPKLGDKAAWAARLAKGKDGLYTSAIKGVGAMPPKGGSTSLPDAQVKLAVDFMVSKAK